MNRLFNKSFVQPLTAVLALVALILAANTSHVAAGEADVIDVKVEALGDNRYRIDVTLEHADTGWDHYANKWDVLSEQGDLLGTRVLAHPHVNEQPFTRSLTLSISSDVTVIVIRAGDSVHEEGGQEMTIDLQQL